VPIKCIAPVNPITCSSTYFFVAACKSSVGAPGNVTVPVKVGESSGAFAAKSVVKLVTWLSAIYISLAVAAILPSASLRAVIVLLVLKLAVILVTSSVSNAALTPLPLMGFPSVPL